MISALQKARSSYAPKLPAALRAGAAVKVVEGAPTAAVADVDRIRGLFPATFGSPVLTFEAAGKEPVISRAPTWLFDVLAWVNKLKKNGKDAIIKFSKWTLTEEMVGDTKVGEHSFAEYIKNCYKK